MYSSMKSVLIKYTQAQKWKYKCKLMKEYLYNGNNRVDRRKSQAMKSVENDITLALTASSQLREEASKIGPAIPHNS